MDHHIKQLTSQLYPNEPELVTRVERLIERYKPRIAAHRERFSRSDMGFPLHEGDAILISYGDTFTCDDRSPLACLYAFLDEVCEGEISGVHILPFSPYSSDDGFSVIDYRAVNPDLGGWEDVRRIAAEYHFMADLVLNHCSARSEWFQRFLLRDERYRNYFITADPSLDYSQVVRPRALPLLTEVETATGPAHVWTTFSADQVDLNWQSSDVLLEMVDIYLSYLASGAQLVRLDAIAYLWKELGHRCIHHPNTHAIVRLFRRVMEIVDPDTLLVTETNVPHDQNISYFGDGDEAHMVYNFSLPPLLLDAMMREDASCLTAWAGGLTDPGEGRCFFNFCASHDGIGLTPTHGILSDEQRSLMVDRVRERGGRVSYKATPEGEIPYELNINYLSGVTDPALPVEQRAAQFLASQGVMFAFAGVPGVYVHSVIGSENWEEGVALRGSNRAINRQQLDFASLRGQLEDERSLRAHVFIGYRALLRARCASIAFHPRSPQRVVEGDPRLVALLRGPFTRFDESSGEEETATVLALQNVSSEVVEFRDRRDRYPFSPEGVMRELISGDIVFPTDEGAFFSLELEPYEVAWLAF